MLMSVQKIAILFSSSVNAWLDLMLCNLSLNLKSESSSEASMQKKNPSIVYNEETILWGILWS